MQETTYNDKHASVTIVETNADLVGSESMLEEQTVKINEQVRTVQYAPALFEVIRQLDGITDTEI